MELSDQTITFVSNFPFQVFCRDVSYSLLLENLSNILPKQAAYTAYTGSLLRCRGWWGGGDGDDETDVSKQNKKSLCMLA